MSEHPILSIHEYLREHEGPDGRGPISAGMVGARILHEAIELMKELDTPKFQTMLREGKVDLELEYRFLLRLSGKGLLNGREPWASDWDGAA